MTTIPHTPNATDDDLLSSALFNRLLKEDSVFLSTLSKDVMFTFHSFNAELLTLRVDAFVLQVQVYTKINKNYEIAPFR